MAVPTTVVTTVRRLLGTLLVLSLAYASAGMAPSLAGDVSSVLVAGGPDRAFVFSKGRLVSQSATETIGIRQEA